MGQIEPDAQADGMEGPRQETGATMDPFTGLTVQELDTLITALTTLLNEGNNSEAEEALILDLRTRVDERIDQLELGI
jgi:hypothetical protein